MAHFLFISAAEHVKVHWQPCFHVQCDVARRMATPLERLDAFAYVPPPPPPPIADAVVLSPSPQPQPQPMMQLVFTGPDPPARKTASSLRSRRLKTTSIPDGCLKRKFRQFVGNENEGPCMSCQRSVLVRTKRHTWQLAHICGWAQTNGAYEAMGIDAAIDNMMPLCPPCNMLAEYGGGQRGGNHFDGLLRAAFGQPENDGKIGRIAAALVPPDAKLSAAENVLQFRRIWGARDGRIGGITEEGVFAAYERWLEAQHAALQLEYKCKVLQDEADKAKQAVQEAKAERLVFFRRHAHLLGENIP